MWIFYTGYLLLAGLVLYLGRRFLLKMTTRLLFLASRTIFLPPEQISTLLQKHGYKNVEEYFIPASTEKINLLFYPLQNFKKTILYCHGNASNMFSPSRVNIIFSFLQEGLQVCIFDYEGYGKSTGNPDIEDIYRDGQAVLEFLKREKGLNPAKDIVVFGKSLGTAVAVHLAYNNEVAGLILTSAFTSMFDAVKSVYPIVGFSWLVRMAVLKDKYRSIDKIPHIRAPMLFLHGTKDELIPLSHSQRLYAAARTPKKTLVEIPDGMHETTHSVNPDLYWDSIERFVDTL